MKISEIEFSTGNKTLQLEPDDDYKYITNGEVFSTLVYLGKNDSVENWHDTNEEPPEPEEEMEEEINEYSE